MNPEHKKAVDDFIETCIKAVKNEFNTRGGIEPEVYFFFEYKNSEDKPFGWVPLPYAKQFFISPAHKQHLQNYIQDCYNGIEKTFRPRMQNFSAELIAVILMCDMYVYNVIHDTAEEAIKSVRTAIPPSKHPLRSEVIGFEVYFEKDQIAYHYPYERRDNKFIFDNIRRDLGANLAGTFKNLFPKK